MRAIVRGCGILWIACALIACGDDDDGKPAVETPNKPRPDAGSGSEPYDGDVPLPRPDSGKPTVDPGDPDPGLTGACAIDSNKIYTVAQSDVPFLSTPLAVDPINSRFAVPYIASDGCLDAVHWANFASAASGGAPKSTMALDDCAQLRGVAATSVGDRWLVATIDNRKSSPWDVWVEPYDSDQNLSGDATRISESSHVETSVALATLRSDWRTMIAWADEDLHQGQALYVRPLDGDGNPVGDAVQIDHGSDVYFTGLALKPMGLEGAGLAYWRYSLDYKISDLVFVTLDGSGKAVRDAWVVAANAGPSASIDLISDNEGGGLVYSRAESQTGRQVWFQQIDSDGQAAIQRTGTTRAPEQRVVNAPARGIDVSLTKLRTGFIVTYRSLPKDDTSMPMLRIYFLDRYGQVIGSSDVSYTSAAGGRTAIQAANDGRVVLGWSQVNEDGTSEIKVVRLPCLGG
jgi:hypothetical protein